MYNIYIYIKLLSLPHLGSKDGHMKGSVSAGHLLVFTRIVSDVKQR